MIRNWLIAVVSVILVLNLIVATAGEKLFARTNRSSFRTADRLENRQIVFTITDGNVLTVTDGLTVEFLKNDFSDFKIACIVFRIAGFACHTACRFCSVANKSQ